MNIFEFFQAHRHGARRSPPHDVEVEAIQHQTTQILHKIHIGPDGDLVEIFNIDSSTRAGDLCKKIASHLDMKNHLGFSLFVHIQDKTISIKEDQFIFDFIRQLTGTCLKYVVPQVPMFTKFFRRNEKIEK